jgi:hypothetical protein
LHLTERAEKEREVANQELLREVARVAFWRILSRLRSSHAKSSRKTSGKPSLVSQLAAAVKSALAQHGESLPNRKVALLSEMVQKLVVSTTALVAIVVVHEDMSNVQVLLMDMLECFSEMANDDGLSMLLHRVAEFDPSTREHLIRTVEKLGRYFSASRDLIRAARTKKYTVFNNIAVEMCQLPGPPNSFFCRNETTLEDSIDNLMEQEPTLKNCTLPASVRTYLGKLYSARSDNFRHWMSSSRTSLKVHAEIQLLFFYEMNKVDMPPRIICSSKSPCYLCHLFFGLHGQFHVPDTHGRVYPGWILPIWLGQLGESQRANMGRITDRLHTALVVQITELVIKKRGRVHLPNESVLRISANWSASSLQPASTEEPQETITPYENSQIVDALGTTLKEYRISSKHEGSPAESNSEVENSQSIVGATLVSHDQSEFKVDPTITRSYFLRSGEVVVMQLTDATMESRIKTKRLDLIFSGESCNKNCTFKPCWVRCELFCGSELPRCSSPLPFDVRSIAPGSYVTFENGSIDSTDDLLIFARDEVLSIKYSATEMVNIPKNESSLMRR